MVNEKRNIWNAKLKRTLASLFPIAKKRKGNCINCGECCKLPNQCYFLKYNKEESYCSIYPIRLQNCRKYPRTNSEHITKDTCGYWFE